MLRTFSLIIFLYFCLSSCSEKIWHTADAKYNRIEISSSPSDDDGMQEMIDPFKDELDGKMNEVIGMLNSELTKSRPESSLGNWLTDAMLDEAQRHTKQKIDFGYYNQGGVRLNYISPGPITVREIYELVPFENEMVVITVPGEYLKSAFDKIAIRGGEPISRNVSFVINEDKAEQIKINGEPLDLEREYKFVLSDYIVNSGSDSEVLKTFPQEELHLKIRDALIEHLRREHGQGVIQFAELEGRITKVNQ